MSGRTYDVEGLIRGATAKNTRLELGVGAQKVRTAEMLFHSQCLVVLLEDAN